MTEIYVYRIYNNATGCLNKILIYLFYCVFIYALFETISITHIT
jgi:hypothetical protein